MVFGSMTGRTATLTRLAGLVLVSWSVVSASDDTPGTSGRALVVSILFAICVAAALLWTARPLGGGRISPDVWALAAAGGLLIGAAPNSAATAFVFVAIIAAGVRVELERAAVVVAVATLALGISAVLYSASAVGVLAYTLGFAVALFAASNARQASVRAEQASLLLAQTQRSHEEQLRATRLQESTRIAREIHDVLSHALAGLSIQLEATIALLDQGAEREALRTRLDRALNLAREGLHETRRAVGVLRGDPVGTSVRIESLVAEYRDAIPEASAELVIDGDPVRLSGESGATLMRVVQEALTNVRKHAPGASVSVHVDAGAGADEELSAVIEDRLGRRASASDLASTGGGFGVRGMRERAESLGGTLEAGPTADGWRVVLRIPSRPLAEARVADPGAVR
jgi:signal transduction histidine kinase